MYLCNLVAYEFFAEITRLALIPLYAETRTAITCNFGSFGQFVQLVGRDETLAIYVNHTCRHRPVDVGNCFQHKKLLNGATDCRQHQLVAKPLTFERISRFAGQ